MIEDADFAVICADEFHVPGVAVTQGSKQGFVVNGRVVMKESGGDKLKLWRHAVSDEARKVGNELWPWQGPILLELRFWIPRPASEPKTWRTWPIKARSGDTDKLARSVLDALTGVAFKDDSQVVVLIVYKDWAINGSTGLDLRVSCLESRLKL